MEPEADAVSSDASSTSSIQTLISFYSSYVRNRFASIIPATNSNWLHRLSNLYLPTARARSKRRGVALPLPLPSSSLESGTTIEGSRVFDVIEDILDHVLSDLHIIQKNLHFWQTRAEGSNASKIYFMVFERGPGAFIDGTVQFIREYAAEGTSARHFYHSASAYISERIMVLTSLRYSLASFLAQAYMEVENFGEELAKDPEKSMPVLLVTINGLFSNLEASIGHLLSANQRKDSSNDNNHLVPLLFEQLPEVNQEGSQWTDCEITDAINLVYQNLSKLDLHLSTIVEKHRKPKKVAQNWVQYTFGVVGLSVCSMWLINHSRLVGSPDIDNWIREAKDSTLGFWNDHVEQPLISIRDELFNTFRKRHKGVMELEEVQLTSSSLHRMLLAFSQQTKGQDIPENTSDQELLEIVMNRYEKELMHPITNLLNGELARALLIQVQKLKLDIETAMLELDQILKANEINFAVLAALPAFFISLLLLMVVRAWLKQDSRAEGRGRVARLQRRLLLVEVEKRIMQHQIYLDEGLEKDAQCMFGLLLYSLDCLYRAVERHARETGEWLCLRQDIIDLAKPALQTSYKLTITSRMERLYDCLLPSLTHK
uniref:Uncharacterized protein n=1 Tax=Kalanchoe fedtschenkoi TaxID=63787 RepID=A0A7N0RJI7_KALFE